MNNTKNQTSLATSDPRLDEVSNAAIVRRFVSEVVNEGRQETIGEVVHPDYRYHGPDGEVADGPDAVWQIVGGLRAAFSDLHAEITSEVAQGDRVVLTLVMTGTQDGELFGIAQAGSRIELPMAVVSRLEDQRIVEEWEYYDVATMMNQINATPSPVGTTLVLGATGKTGRRVLDRLKSAGYPVRAASRSSETPFDWEDEGTWAPVLADIDAVYICYYPDLAFPGASEIVARFADLAVATGIRRLVLLSGRGEEGARQAEQRVQESGAGWTLVRCAFFNQNFSEMYDDGIRSGRLAMPAGDTTEPFVDADDIADVMVAALTDDRHIGQLYELTGPRLLSLEQVAAELSAAIGRHVRYEPVTVDEFAAELMDHGLPAQDAGPFAELIGEVLDGHNAYLTDGVQRALGRPPRDFTTWANDAAAAGSWFLETR